MMRAPHPALQGLYRQAATPTQLTARLQLAQNLANPFFVEPIIGGRGSEVLFDRLLIDLQLSDVLNGSLSRLERQNVPAAPVMTPALYRHQPIVAPVTANSPPTISRVADTPFQPGITVPESLRAPLSSPFVPEAHPRLSRLLRQHGKPASTPRVNPPITNGRTALPDADSAYRQMIEKAARSGTVVALHQAVMPHVSKQTDTAMVATTVDSLPGAGQAYAASVLPVVDSSSTTPVNRPHADRIGPNTSGSGKEPGLVKLLPKQLTTLIKRIDSKKHAMIGTPGLKRGTNGPLPAKQSRPGAGSVSDFHEISWNAATRLQDPIAPRATTPSLDPTQSAAMQLQAPLGGLRGLIAVARSQQTADNQTKQPNVPAEMSQPTGFDNSDLIGRISTELRREAVRYGIDITGTKP